MKIINSLTLLILLVGTVFFQAGCKKKNDPQPDPPAPTGPFAVTVAGSPLTFTSVSPSMKKYVFGQTSGTYFSILGNVGAGNDYFALSIFYNDIAINTSTDISSGRWDVVYYTTSMGMRVANSDNVPSGASGTLTLTKKDLVNKRMEGSFSGVMVDSKGGKFPFTSGTFAINY